MNKQDMFGALPAYSAARINEINRELRGLLQKDRHKVIVLDDDPTGVQTVHDVKVYTRWDKQEVLRGFLESPRMFFILTNSRSFSRERTAEVHREIAESILYASKESGFPFLVISRGDSTLRGHFPLETETLKEALEAQGEIHGEVIVPFFPEGGRYTLGNTHYLEQDGQLIPVGQTHYAQDQTFGYHHSHLGQWIEEKTAGRYPAAGVRYVTLEMLREGREQEIVQLLMETTGFGKIVVNAAQDADVRLFTCFLLKAMLRGKRFLFRTAASFPKVLGGIGDRPLLTPGELVTGSAAGGLVIIGSHVEKTTCQLGRLMALEGIDFVELNQHLVIEDGLFSREINRVRERLEESMGRGVTCVVYTRRERLDIGGGKERELEVAVKISNGISGIVKDLTVPPRFLIAKGGITSSEIATTGMGVTKALVLGQIRLGVPVWRILSSDKFTGIPYIIFPGNVGGDDDLRDVVEELMQHTQNGTNERMEKQ